jgi:hypothetical protein
MHWRAFLQVNKSRELDRLVGRLDELLACFPEQQNPELDALRDKVDRTILVTWQALGNEHARSTARLRHQGRIAMTLAAMFVGIAAGALARRML